MKGAPARWPPAAVCKGDEDVGVPDVICRTDQVRFHRETCSSPSPHPTDRASWPPGDRGPFGPGIKRVARVFDCGAPMRAPTVAALVRRVGGRLAAGQVSTRRINEPAAFHAETAARSQAGLASSPWPHLDDTSPRVHGQTGYGHRGGHPLSTASFTTAAKARLPVIEGLTPHRPRRVRVNAAALGALAARGRAAVRRRPLAQLPGEGSRADATMPAWLETPLPGLGPPPRQWILDATAGAADHAAREFPVVRLVVGADAPPVPVVTEARARCGGHEGRHDTKLVPYVPHHRTLVEAFVPRVWTD